MSKDETLNGNAQPVTAKKNTSIQKLVTEIDESRSWMQLAALIGVVIGSILTLLSAFTVINCLYGYFFNVGVSTYQGSVVGSTKTRWLTATVGGINIGFIGMLFLVPSWWLFLAGKAATSFKNGRKSEDLLKYVSFQKKIWRFLCFFFLAAFFIIIAAVVALYFFRDLRMSILR